MPPFVHRNPWALTALALALIAVGLCVAATGVGYRTQPGPLGLGHHADGNGVGAALRVIGAVLAFLGLGSATVAWIRREHVRVWLAALALAVVAMAWEYALLGVAVALILLIVGSLLSSF